jgi:hypothetical protein
MRGTHLELTYEGEGWFRGVDKHVLGGTIEEGLGRVFGAGDWYTVRLDHVLEVQESGHQTVSGYRLVRFERLLVSARHAGEELTLGRSITTYVCLVPEGVEPVEHLRRVSSPDLWASCKLGA